jgi:tetratricopeptide (TPR) repeat protein
MSETSTLDARVSALREAVTALEAGGDPAARDPLRQEILAIGRAIDEEMRQLAELKEEMRPIVASYQTAFPRTSVPPSPARADHLGSSTYRERGWSALAGGEYEQAVQQLEHAHQLDPTEVGTMALLAWAHLRLDQLPQARLLLDRAAGSSSEHPLVVLCSGYAAMNEGDMDRALTSFRRVVEAGTDRTATLYAHLYQGMVYAQIDMHRDAQTSYRRALELGPSLTEAYWELGRSHRQEGRDDLALEAWRAGGENRFNPWGQQCREAVERLEAARPDTGDQG